MKAILMSIKPKLVAKILNGEKTIEIRKRFPLDYVGWVYIYCTQEKNHHDILIKHAMDGVYRVGNCFGTNNGKEHNEPLNGKVIARFWCNKVEYIEATYDEYNYGEDDYATETLRPETLYDETCVSREQMFNYLGLKGGYAIPISKLEIYDKPKELNEFYGYTDKKIGWYSGLPKVEVLTSLFKAPQSRQYIEVKYRIIIRARGQHKYQDICYLLETLSRENKKPKRTRKKDT